MNKRHLKSYFTVFLFTISIILVEPIGAQENTADTVDSGWGGYPVVYYTDQTSLAFGGYGLHYFLNKKTEYQSTLGLALIYTLNKQIIADLTAKIYWQNSRLQGTLAFIKFPNIFYPIGPNSSNDDAEDFTTNSITFDPIYYRKLTESYFVGPAYSYEYHNLIKTEESGILAGKTLIGTRDPFSVSGLGMSFLADTRDHAVYSKAGFLYQANIILYDRLIGSEYDFTLYYIDLRNFFTLSKSSLIGLQLTLTALTGTVPIQKYAILGDDRLRGFSARYWDKSMLTIQSEFRSKITERLGYTIFAGAGTVAKNPENFDLNKCKYGFGIGFRYLVIPETKLNLRIDFGLGSDNNSSLSFLPGEAF